MAVVATWDAADASGIRNVFRNLFDVPIGAFTTPPLLSITFDASGGRMAGGGGTPPLPPGGSQFIATAISGTTYCDRHFGGRIYVIHPCVLSFGNNQNNFQKQLCPTGTP